MTDSFKALILNQEGENFIREVKSIDKSFLKHGNVLVKVDYSSLNFKDALILKNGARLVKEFPHIPGIDFSGTVEESENDKFKPGDEIILTGWRVGEIFYGGFSQYAKVNGDFLVKRPKDLTSKQAMIMGTAGFTALQCAFTAKTTREELLLGEKVENVIVTGASGGVGSIAVMILNKLGCNVTAVTGKESNKEYLQSIGAKNIINTSDLNKDSRPLDKGLWDGAVDTVGGQVLANLVNFPTVEEQVRNNSGVIGFIIIGVGIVGILLGFLRLLLLSLTSIKVRGQLKKDKPTKNNPLGRVLMVAENNPSADTETLELKLGEAILQETPALESMLTLIKMIATIAPLGGLLGTVTGMIQVFQQITVYGAGDPTIMAGGISQALMTTVLGIVVAIPTIFMHTVVKSRSDNIIHILEEQATGMIAQKAERLANNQS